VVHLTEPGHETVDPIFLTGGAPTPVTRIVWGASEALARTRDLTRTHLGGNLLPATQGQRFTESFAIGAPPPSAPDAVLAIARMGPNGSDTSPNFVFRYPLAQGPLGWLAGADASSQHSLVLDSSGAVAAAGAGKIELGASGVSVNSGALEVT
jgi:hypothetical protein